MLPLHHSPTSGIEKLFLNRKVYYIENWSVWMDIKILAKTVEVVLKHEGAV